MRLIDHSYAFLIIIYFILTISTVSSTQDDQFYHHLRDLQTRSDGSTQSGSDISTPEIIELDAVITTETPTTTKSPSLRTTKSPTTTFPKYPFYSNDDNSASSSSDAETKTKESTLGLSDVGKRALLGVLIVTFATTLCIAIYLCIQNSEDYDENASSSEENPQSTVPASNTQEKHGSNNASKSNTNNPLNKTKQLKRQSSLSSSYSSDIVREWKMQNDPDNNNSMLSGYSYWGGMQSSNPSDPSSSGSGSNQTKRSQMSYSSGTSSAPSWIKRVNKNDNSLAAWDSPNHIHSPGSYLSGGSLDSFSLLRTPTRPTVSTFEDQEAVEFLYSLNNNPIFRANALIRKDIVLGPKIGEGAYGEVYKSEYRGNTIAVKRLLPSKAKKVSATTEFAVEIELCAHLKHPNIVSFLGVAWTNSENLCMAMEYVATGDLRQYLQTGGDHLSWQNEKIEMVYGVVEALAYLHAWTPPVLHRNLMAKNILITENLQLKLIDFGAVADTMASLGNAYWVAPEVLGGNDFTEKSDIYAVGTLLLELDTCEIPYQLDIRTEDIDQIDSVSQGIVNLAIKCLSSHPLDRPTATEILDALNEIKRLSSLTIRRRFECLKDDGPSSPIALLMSDTMYSSSSTSNRIAILETHDESTGQVNVKEFTL